MPLYDLPIFDQVVSMLQHHAAILRIGLENIPTFHNKAQDPFKILKTQSPKTIGLPHFVVECVSLKSAAYRAAHKMLDENIQRLFLGNSRLDKSRL